MFDNINFKWLFRFSIIGIILSITIIIQIVIWIFNHLIG